VNENTFSSQDSQRISNIASKLLTMQRYIIDTARPLTGSNSGDCLMNMHNSLEGVYANLQALETLVLLSSTMVNQQDESTVNRYIVLDVKHSFKSTSTARQSVNGVAGICSGYAIVTTKAQAILYLLTEVESTLQAITRLRLS
jgi:hypothetical protein